MRFSYKDYADGSRYKTLTLTAAEFIRRFLMYVLPPGFMRIRYYGLPANRTRQASIQRCRQLLADAPSSAMSALEPAADAVDLAVDASRENRLCCPHCGRGSMRLLRASPRRIIPPKVLFGPVAA